MHAADAAAAAAAADAASSQYAHVLARIEPSVEAAAVDAAGAADVSVCGVCRGVIAPTESRLLCRECDLVLHETCRDGCRTARRRVRLAVRPATRPA